MQGEPTPLSIILDTVTRLESKTDAGFATVAAKMDQKADKTDIAQLNLRLDGHEKRIERTETALRDKDTTAKTQEQLDAARKNKRQARFNATIAFISAAALVVSVLIGLH